ncbi:hypothetical protein MTO96_017167 [Rhipicephalus appendiculatus]
MAANLTTQIMEIFKGLAKVSDKPASSDTCRVRKLNHVDYNVRTFVTAVFNGDISPNTTVIVRNSDAILGGLVRLTHNLDVQHFLNYLGFRLLVRLALLLPEHLVNMRRLFSVEFIGRVVREDLKWLLCMRLAEAVAPSCLENVQADMFREEENVYSRETALAVPNGRFLLQKFAPPRVDFGEGPKSHGEKADQLQVCSCFVRERFEV